MPETKLVNADELRIIQAVMPFHINVQAGIKYLSEFRIPDIFPDAIDLINRVGFICRQFGFVGRYEIAVCRLKQSLDLCVAKVQKPREYYGAFCSSRPELEQHHSGQKAAALEACDILAISSRLLAPSITARP